jgi:hypothetical protein
MMEAQPPGATPTAVAAAVRGLFTSQTGKPHRDTTTRNKRQTFWAKLSPDGEPFRLSRREAQTLALLIERGSLGFTSGEASPVGWARRTSEYIRKLRSKGVAIVTTREAVADGARVGRYVLTAPAELASAPQG